MQQAKRERRKQKGEKRNKKKKETKKLFAVSKERGIPIFTFVNKIDHFGRSPFDLMEEIENVLGQAKRQSRAAQDFAMSKNSLILVLQKQTRESDDRHGKDTN